MALGPLLLAIFLPLGAPLVMLLLAYVFRHRRACLAERVVEAPFGPDMAFERGLAGVALLRGSARVTVASRVAGRIEATVGMTWASFGEVVTLVFTPGELERTEVRVASWSRLGTTLADYGKNRINVAMVAAVLEYQGDDAARDG